MSLIEEKQLGIQLICTRLGVEKLFAFGSVNRNDFGPESDVDFLVEIGNKDPLAYTETYFALAEELEHLLGRKVDLVTKNSLQNPYFIKSVEASKKLIYAA